MELIIFASERHYRKAQKRSNSAKTTRAGFTGVEMDVVSRRIESMPSGGIRGICHGARTGEEAIAITSRLSRPASIECTDLFPKGPNVRKWDFRHEENEWIGVMDFVYSNCLDHARNPTDCMETWLKQLKPDGVLLIQWTPNHIGVLGGDCFGAALHEYIGLMNEVGRVLELLYCHDSHIVLVGGKATDG